MANQMNVPVPIADDLLLPAEVAQVCRIGLAKVYEMIRQGDLPHVRLGERGVRIPKRQFEAWLAQNTVGGTAKKQ